MEVCTNQGEITKSFKVAKFFSYSHADDKIISKFYVNIDKFRSKWKLVLYPMHPCKVDEDKSSVNCDILLELHCLFSSAPPSVVKNIEVEATIRGRERFPSLLNLQQNEVKPTWRRAVVSRVILESCKLIPKDVFEFDLRFKVSEDLVCRSVDGILSVAKNMHNLMKDNHYCDTCITSSCGTKFFAHSSILHARSNLLKKAQSLSHSHFQNVQEEFPHFMEETVQSNAKDPVNHPNILGNLTSSTSSLSDANLGSPFKDETPLFTFSADKLSRTNEITSSSSQSFKKKEYTRLCGSIGISPRKIKSGSLTPKLISEKIQSPNKPFHQSQKKCLFPRSSSLDVKGNGAVSDSFIHSLSPIKNESATPFSRHEVHRKSSSVKKENKTPISHMQIKKVRQVDVRSPCQMVKSPNTPNLKRKLFEELTEEPKNNFPTVLKLNMSSSVLHELLLWIYTGESHRLGELARPLLVAALRYDIEDLADAAQFHLASILSRENILEMLLLSHKYGADVLEEEAMQFALLNAGYITSLPAWEELSIQYPELLLRFTRRLASSHT